MSAPGRRGARLGRAGIPEPLAGTVEREALVGRLRDARDTPLVLVTAPPGYGKSTVLAQWARSRRRPPCWVTLRPHYTSAALASIAIIEAIASVRKVGRADVAPGSDPVDALRRLVGSCDGLALVLDDAHAPAPSVLSELAHAILESLCDGSQLVLASRTEPALPVGRLRTRGAVAEIGMDELSMSPAEAATLLAQAGLDLGDEAAATLVARTEGWPAALYLAALSLRGRPDVAAGAARFGGDDHLVHQYLQDEVLDALPAETREFLIGASALELVSGPACDEVLGQGSARRLAALARENPLLIAVGSDHRQYRLHPLLRDALRAELHRTESRRGYRLHRRASRWCERFGDLDGAIEHAIAAGQCDRAGELLWAHLVAYVAHGRNDTVQRWLGRFRADQIEGHPPLALAAAHSCLALGRLAHAQHWALAAATASQSDDAAAPQRSLPAGLELVRAMAAGVAAADIAAAAADAYAHESEDSPWRPLCCLLRGAAERLLGHADAAAVALEEGVRLAVVPAPLVGSLCLAQLASIAIDDDDWESAAELSEQALELLATEGLRRYPTAAIVFAAAAAARAHGGHADEAKLLFRHGRNLLAELPEFTPWYGVQTRLLLARAAVGLADAVAARTLLAEASRLARRTPGVVGFQNALDDAWERIDSLAESALSGPSSLTVAELRILRFLSSHESLREIAGRLGVSVNTVKTHAHAIYRKLNVASRSEAVARASEAGLLGM